MYMELTLYGVHFNSGIVNSIVTLFSLNAYSDVGRQLEDRGSTNNTGQQI